MQCPSNLENDNKNILMCFVIKLTRIELEENEKNETKTMLLMNGRNL